MANKWTVPYHGASEDFLRSLIATTETACIPWPYGRDKKGYGFAVVSGKQRRAHNWMCRLAHGEPFSIWKHAAHRCGNPPCVNPNHLRWTTHIENMADKEIHGTVNRGERNGKTTITEAEVLAIRNAPPDLAALSARYGLCRGALSKIRAGKRWPHVGGPRSSGERNSWPTCKHGHEYDEKNTRWTKDGYRVCRACDARNTRARRKQAENDIIWSNEERAAA